jgi:hypothetical protein
MPALSVKYETARNAATAINIMNIIYFFLTFRAIEPPSFCLSFVKIIPPFFGKVNE